MRPLTVFLGRLLGLYFLMTIVWMMTSRTAALEIISQMIGDRPIVVVLALVALGGGLAIVLAHNIWYGGALPILVTLTGWAMLIRSLFLLFASTEETTRMLEAMQFARFFYLYMCIPLALGVALTYLGFTTNALEHG